MKSDFFSELYHHHFDCYKRFKFKNTKNNPVFAHVISMPQVVRRCVKTYEGPGTEYPGDQVLLANNVAIHTYAVFSSAHCGHVKCSQSAWTLFIATWGYIYIYIYIYFFFAVAAKTLT